MAPEIITTKVLANAAPIEPHHCINKKSAIIFTTHEITATNKLNFIFLCVTNKFPDKTLNVPEKK